MENTVFNPPVPFFGNIPGGLYPGRVIVIQGSIPHGAVRFNADLCYGEIVALHVNPRFDAGCIVRNHCNNTWGSEERHPHGLGGLIKGQSFEMMIMTEPTHYKIAINGRHFTEFAHRLPYENVQSLQIRGDIQLRKIEFRLNYSPPSYPPQVGYPFAVCPSGPPSVPPSASKHRPIYNPALPLKYPVFGGISVGNSISISGRPTNTPHRFVINLCCGSCGYSGDVALHFNPRFDQMSVVRNSLMCGNWGTEERAGIFPFQAAVNFDMIIRVFPNCFEITINGQYFGTFTHRVMPPSRVDMIEMDGDVIISYLHVQ